MSAIVPRTGAAWGRQAFDSDRLDAWERLPGGLLLVLMALALAVAVPATLIIALHDAVRPGTDGSR